MHAAPAVCTLQASERFLHVAPNTTDERIHELAECWGGFAVSGMDRVELSLRACEKFRGAKNRVSLRRDNSICFTGSHLILGGFAMLCSKCNTRMSHDTATVMGRRSSCWSGSY